jgi:2-amino-4-hydroxy-6-hydroxymethyldihydropteridine diphosphokinase
MPIPTMKYHIGLGSNIGERKKNLDQSVLLLKKNGVQIVRESSIYETSPVGMEEQPWFLNQVLEIQTELEPEALLELAKKIEERMGRKSAPPAGPRCIDIDILLAEDKIVHLPGLIIPHPEMARRNFVLVPLKEIAPKTVHPVLQEKIEDIWQNNSDTSIVKLYVSV